MTHNGLNILYDSGCGLCSRIIQFISHHSGNKEFNFIPLESETGKTTLLAAGFPGDYRGSVVYLKGGKVFIRSTAVLNILKDMGGPWKLFYVLIVIPPFIRNFIYTIIARFRYMLYRKQKPCNC